VKLRLYLENVVRGTKDALNMLICELMINKHEKVHVGVDCNEISVGN
jgi:hypothetical protein